MSVFPAFVNGLATENPGLTGLVEVEVKWLNEFRKQLISASDVGRFLQMWNIRETHPKRGPVRTLVRYRMRTPDPALPEDAQNINRAGTHPPAKVLLHRKGIEQEGPVTTDEQRAKDAESTRTSTQEDGGASTCNGKRGLTSTKLTSRNRWLSGVLEEDDEDHMSLQ